MKKDELKLRVNVKELFKTQLSLIDCNVERIEMFTISETN